VTNSWGPDPNLPSITRHTWLGPVQVVPDPEYAPRYPSRKTRGLRRYYRGIARKAAGYRIDTEDGSWYDFWHVHVGRDGLGDHSWRARRQHLVALFDTFRSILLQIETEGWTTPHQVWVYIDPTDSAMDAVYVHTPNPNHDNFPHAFENVDWTAPVPERLRDLITDPAWQFGRSTGRWTAFFVRVRPG
jgi:hypothetical protein